MYEVESESYSLRPAAEADLPKILDLERKIYPFPWTQEAFRNELVKPFANVFVLQDDASKTAVGYIVYWLLFDECHVLNVTIDPQFRGRGLGTRLIRKAVNDASRKDMKRVFLEVRTSNTAAIALYQKLGFHTDHVKKQFYEDGEDAYFMVLYINRTIP